MLPELKSKRTSAVVWPCVSGVGDLGSSLASHISKFFSFNFAQVINFALPFCFHSSPLLPLPPIPCTVLSSSFAQTTNPIAHPPQTVRPQPRHRHGSPAGAQIPSAATAAEHSAPQPALCPSSPPQPLKGKPKILNLVIVVFNFNFNFSFYL